MNAQDDHPMTVRGLALDPVTNAPIVILKDEAGSRLLPIWIGLFEANAIAIEMEKIAAPRKSGRPVQRVDLYSRFSSPP